MINKFNDKVLSPPFSLNELDEIFVDEMEKLTGKNSDDILLAF
jgi:hypothetical protein